MKFTFYTDKEEIVVDLTKVDEREIARSIANSRARRAGRRQGGAKVTRLAGAIKADITVIQKEE